MKSDELSWIRAIQGTQWTLGAAIYAGWCASAIYIGVAIIMFMGCCGGSDDEEEEYDVDCNAFG